MTTRDAMKRRTFLLGSTAALAMLVPVSPVESTEQPLVLRWVQLIPPPDPSQPRKLRPFFPPPPTGPPDHPRAAPGEPDGKFMSLKSLQPDADMPPAVVKELDGKRVQIGGYIVPLDFEATKIKEFLLVPFVGACIHVPPPPSNQVIHVAAERPFQIRDLFDPVWVTGRIRVVHSRTDLADAGYSIAAERVEAR